MTMAFICIDKKSLELTYLNAGHLPVYLCSRGQVKSFFKGSDPLGYNNSMKPIKEKTKNGDFVFLFTDGLVENGPRRFSMRKLRKILSQSGGVTEAVEAVTELYHSNLSENPKDDCMFIAVDVA